MEEAMEPAVQPIKRRKRVLTPRIAADQPVPPKPKKTATIIYRPEPGEPAEVVCFQTELDLIGVRFRANEPVELPYSKTIKQLLVEKFEHADGMRSRAIERDVPCIEVLRHNPAFEIDGVQEKRKKAATRVPTSADEYRGYAISWISVSMSAQAMDHRWAGEEGLRQRCGVTPSDIAYLRPYFDARHMECAELDAQRKAGLFTA